MITHTQQCIDDQTAFQLRRDVFEAKYPNRCKTCDGTGGFSYREARPYGSTVAYEEMWDACPTCGDASVCPLCGAPGLSDELNIIYTCGHTEDQGQKEWVPKTWGDYMGGPCPCVEEYDF